MPKSTKKQKDKSTDFKKARLKLGKGKKPANNAVDTSFKAHSIALPMQSITADKSEAGPSTRRRHNLSELISLTRHYSAGSRKDALAGLRELFASREEVLQSSTSLVIPACCKMISDEDASVRKALWDFLDWYLHRTPQICILPHAPTLLLFTTSAQSHIFPEIRVDAIHILNILLDVIPDAVTSKGPSGHGDRVLQGCCGLLGGGTSNNDTDTVNMSATVLSAQSKLLIIALLERFLKASANSRETVGDAFWYLRCSFASARAHESFVKLVQQQRSDQNTDKRGHAVSLNSNRTSAIEHAIDALAIAPSQEDDLMDALDGGFSLASEGLPGIEKSYAQIVERVLHKFLVEVWLDNAPGAFLNLEGPLSKVAELRLVHAVVKLAQTIYYDILQGPSHADLTENAAISHLEVFLSHLATYLPLPRDSLVRAETESLTQQLDLMFSELLTLALLQTSLTEIDGTVVAQKSRTKLQSLAKMHLPRVSLWIEDSLRSKPTPNRPTGHPLSEQVAMAITPTIWAILAQKGQDQQSHVVQMGLFQALIDRVRGSELSIKPRGVLIQFVVILNLLQREPEYIGHFRIQAILPAGASLVTVSQATQSKMKLMEGALLHLPKVLWELGISTPEATQKILFLLLRCVQRAALDYEPSTMTSTSQRFAPFFVVEHPNLGLLYGPFKKLPSTIQGLSCQKMALDLAFSLCKGISPNSRPDESPPGSAAAGLAQSVSTAIQGTQYEAYWKHLISQ